MGFKDNIIRLIILQTMLKNLLVLSFLFLSLQMPLLAQNNLNWTMAQLYALSRG